MIVSLELGSMLRLELPGEAVIAGEHAEQWLTRLDSPDARLAIHGVDRHVVSGTDA